VPVPQSAMALCGVYTGSDDTGLLPLVIDPTGLNRRRVWEAWKSNGERCGQSRAGSGGWWQCAFPAGGG